MQDMFNKLGIQLIENGLRDMFTLKLDINNLTYSDVIDSLKTLNYLICIAPYFERGNNVSSVGTSDVFYVKLKELNDTISLKRVASNTNLKIIKPVPNMPKWYMLSIRNSQFSNSIEATNYIYETKF